MGRRRINWSRDTWEVWYAQDISGQIGEPCQTDKLTFVSLSHLIDFGLKRQYKESEVVSLHSSLRNYVETLNYLSLPKLRKIFRVHNREKSASELYQQLTTVFQHPKETAQQFLLRALDLRNSRVVKSQNLMELCVFW